jgi:glycerol-3-phosphate O-acyltransferase / dihydroxyacetone phosphate acyltransferase
LSRYGIADHEVQQLKQATESAILSFIELCFIFIVSLIVGLVPAVLWGPVRFASSYLAEQHRKKALAASKVKVTGRDVVARYSHVYCKNNIVTMFCSYKILTLMVLLPSANLLYSLIFALFYCS